MNWTPVENRRSFLGAGLGGAAGFLAGRLQSRAMDFSSRPTVAQIAITLDLEMARNFPKWEDTHWDYEKGNLDEAAKRYAVKTANIVKGHGGRVHFFCVGRVLEQQDVSWLKQLAADGHPIGNHTYDHVNLLASEPKDLQYRFQRSPWLIEGMSTSDVIRENIRMTTAALKQRAGISNNGFRTPGGFSTGLSGREDLQNMLIDLGFSWVSSRYPTHENTAMGVEPNPEVFASIIQSQAQAQPFVYPTGLIEIPMSPISDIGAFRNGRWKLEWFLEAIRQAVDWTIKNGAVFDFLAHPSCLGVVDPELQAIDLICKLVEQAGGNAKLVDLDQIAKSVVAPFPK